MKITAARFVDSVILAIAREAKFSTEGTASMEAVEEAALDDALTEEERAACDDSFLRRRIGFAFRNKREGYVGKGTALTRQVARGVWGLTEAGVEYARQVAGVECDPERIITLNMGLGRDSIAMLCLLIEDGLIAEGRKLTKEDIDCVVFSDLDAEWDHTYAQLPKVRALCEEHGIRFIVLAKPTRAEQEADWARRREYRAANPGKKVNFLPAWFTPWKSSGFKTWAKRPWTGTIEDKAAAGGYHLRGSIIQSFTNRSPKPTIASRRGDCTDNHKIHPIRKLVRDLAWERFDMSGEAWSKLVKAGKRKKHLTLIGIAADEASRTENGGNGPGFITEAYPLVEMGIAKGDEQPILDRWGFGDVKKSGCRMCPYQGIAWFAALKLTNPEQFAEAVEYEAAALALNPKMFISGGRPIAEQVDRWLARNPDPDIEAILDKSYSRCSKLAKIKKAA